MGIHINLVPQLLNFSKRENPVGTILTLGVQGLPDNEDPDSFYKKLGFSGFETLDRSNFEGAQHIFDLNNEALPESLTGRFGAVLNGGTMEHIFHVPNALNSMTKMLQPKGYVIHIVPCNGWVNHGFYQISPTLMFDYYAAAGFRLIESFLCSFDLETPEKWTLRFIDRDDLGHGNAGAIVNSIHNYVFIAQRGDRIIEQPIPTQFLYSNKESDAHKTLYKFETHNVINGVISQ